MQMIELESNYSPHCFEDCFQVVGSYAANPENLPEYAFILMMTTIPNADYHDLLFIILYDRRTVAAVWQHWEKDLR